jgi:hypothetical protein
LEKAGLQVISGKRSLKAALEAGKAVIAVGDRRECYKITSQNEQLVVDAIGAIESPLALGVIVQRESAAAVVIVRSVS